MTTHFYTYTIHKLKDLKIDVKASKVFVIVNEADILTRDFYTAYYIAKKRSISLKDVEVVARNYPDEEPHVEYIFVYDTKENKTSDCMEALMEIGDVEVFINPHPQFLEYLDECILKNMSIKKSKEN